MKHSWKTNFLWIAVAVVVLSGACASQKSQVVIEQDQAYPVEAVNRLGSAIATARGNHLNILSPSRFAKADALYLEAQEDLEKGRDIADIMALVGEANANLKSAEENAKLARTTLADVIESRELARSAGATQLGADYAKVERKFLELTKAIEQNNLNFARKNRDGVASAYHQLELRSIKIETIGEVRKLLQQAREAGARKIAPTSYALAEEKLAATDAFITANPYAKEQMHTKAAEALFLAQRVLAVTEQSEQFKEMEPEQITLWIENVLHQITEKMSAPDMRNQNYQTQVENALASIEALQNDRQFLYAKSRSQQEEIEDLKRAYDSQTEALNKRIAILEGRTQEEQQARERMATEKAAAENRLAAEKRFNQMYQEIQDFFDSGEAEVYKQQNLMFIRLKAIHFPVGKSTILPDNYPLLSKVQRAIRTFDEPLVVIEGHTDSTGPEEFNEHLSQKRADAVRKYLIANQALPEDHIAAIGYGSKRPLASNATSEGRAINRRIDVIIEPKVPSSP